jgi:hypothetical protein
VRSCAGFGTGALLFVYSFPHVVNLVLNGVLSLIVCLIMVINGRNTF